MEDKRELNDMHNAKAIILDIEGTTTSISFVKDTLFPYIRKHLTEYLEKNWENEQLKEDVKLLKEQYEKDKEAKVDGAVPIEDNDKSSVEKNVLWQMDQDRKTTALKQLQGHMWAEGYASGELKGHVYDDVPACIKKWSRDGRKLYIYSSGSVDAQKLLFGATTAGSLLEHLTGHYDTKIGAKKESSSYDAIAKDIGLAVDQIIFMTDVVAEALAAMTAGLHAVLVEREGNAPLTEQDKSTYHVISTFEDLFDSPSSKRVKTDADDIPVETAEEAMEVETAKETTAETETKTAPEDGKVSEAKEAVEDKPSELVDEKPTETADEKPTQEPLKSESEAMETDVSTEKSNENESKEDKSENKTESSGEKKEEEKTKTAETEKQLEKKSETEVKTSTDTEKNESETEKAKEPAAETANEDKKSEETALAETEEKSVAENVNEVAKEEKVEEAKTVVEEKKEETVNETATDIKKDTCEETEPVAEKKTEDVKEEAVNGASEDKPEKTEKEEKKDCVEEKAKNEINGVNGDKKEVVETTNGAAENGKESNGVETTNGSTENGKEIAVESEKKDDIPEITAKKLAEEVVAAETPIEIPVAAE